MRVLPPETLCPKKYPPPKKNIGHGSVAPLVDRDRRPWPTSNFELNQTALSDSSGRRVKTSDDKGVTVKVSAKPVNRGAGITQLSQSYTTRPTANAVIGYFRV